MTNKQLAIGDNLLERLWNPMFSDFEKRVGDRTFACAALRSDDGRSGRQRYWRFKFLPVFPSEMHWTVAISLKGNLAAK